MTTPNIFYVLKQLQELERKHLQSLLVLQRAEATAAEPESAFDNSSHYVEFAKVLSSYAVDQVSASFALSDKLRNMYHALDLSCEVGANSSSAFLELEDTSAYQLARAQL